MAGSEPRPEGEDAGARRDDGMAGELRTESPSAKRAFARAVESLLGHGARTLDHLEDALKADPDLGIAHLVKGFALKSLGRRDLASRIDATREAAEACFRRRAPTARETSLVDALTLWTRGRNRAAAERLDAHLEHAPHDLLAIKLAHGLRFMMGDAAGMRRSIEAPLEHLDPGRPGYGFALGCLAFALEETAAHDLAEVAGRQALDAEPENPWALHAVAHVFYETERMREGAEWLADHEKTLEGVNNLAGHIMWHRALFEIETGAVERARERLDRDVAVYPLHDFRDVSNRTSLLLLLAARGLSTPERWTDLVRAAADRMGDHGYAFADVHYVLALAAAGRTDEARRFVTSMEHSARERQGDFDARVTRDVGVPLAEACVAAFCGQLDHAHEIVMRLGTMSRRLGGSRAQRRVIGWALDAARVAATEARVIDPRENEEIAS